MARSERSDELRKRAYGISLLNANTSVRIVTVANLSAVSNVVNTPPSATRFARRRRFRSAQEAREAKEVQDQVRSSYASQGRKPPPEKEPWDSNVITPGTDFMAALSEYVKYWVRCRVSEGGDYWKTIKVVFSDAFIPGEGEHKIMSHIRLHRSSPGHDPNQHHVLHGLDADLIMLGLATHEVNFHILREEVAFGRRR